jgi:esterase/lipase
MKNTLAKINHTIWELRQEIARHPDDGVLKREMVQFFFESRYHVERRDGVAEEDRSFLLMQEREAICCFLIHGAGGSPREMRELGRFIFQQGFTVYAMRLPLEIPPDAAARRIVGSSSRAKKHRLRRTGGEEVNGWSVCLSESAIVLDTLLSYNTNTYVIGFSFGGTLALNLLAMREVKGTILIAPALFAATTGRSLAFQFARKILPVAVRRMAPREHTVLELMERTRSGMQPIDAPICVIQAADDPLVSTRGFALLKSASRNAKARFLLLPSGGHLLIAGEHARDVFVNCTDFIREI